MKAHRLHEAGPLDGGRLRLEDVPDPMVGAGELLLRVKACGVCRTDLHIVEGELDARPAPPHGDMAVPASAEWDALDEHTVAEVMSHRILSVAPAADVTEVARRMDAEGVHRVMVMDGDVLLGIVTALDLARAVARGELGPPAGRG